MTATINNKSSDDPHVPLISAAAELDLSPNGLLHTLKKTNSAIRDDGHWFCTRTTIERIKSARRDLGIAKRGQR